jgi:hypothetical protein
MMDHPDTPDIQDTPDTTDTTVTVSIPDTPGTALEVWESQGKLILPAPAIEYNPAHAMQETVLRPEPLLPPRFYKSEAVPMQPLARLVYYWRKDPAYKVFMIATCMVLIAGTVFVTLASAAVIKQPNLFGLSAASTTPQKPSVPTPSGTVNFQPVFPTPGGGTGTTESSQPPVVNTPALPTTPTPSDSDATPTPTNSGGQLTAQITSIPQQVSDGQTVQVVVNTSLPGATVYLQVTYNAAPYFYISGTQQSDGNGNVALTWHVQASGFARGHIIARVFAVATLNGQSATSQEVTVQVTAIGPLRQ